MADQDNLRPLLVSLETDALLIDFVLSTNSDDPAGIQREKDIKPRLTQMKLDSAPPPARPTAHSRARSVRPSVPPAPSANFSKHVGLASHAHESRPLFNPPDDDDQMEETEGDNEDTLWNDIDQADPTFSQLALNLETSTPQPAYEEGNREEKPTRQPRKQPEVIDMSLEDDSDASSTCMPTAKSKKSKKVGVMHSAAGRAKACVCRIGNWEFEVDNDNLAKQQRNREPMKEPIYLEVGGSALFYKKSTSLL